MKKLIFVFVALFMLVLISGCGARQNTIRYNNEGESGDKTAMTGGTPENVKSDEADSETTEEAESEEEAPAVNSLTGKLAVTSFDAAFLKTNLSYNVVKGTTPSDTHKITINDYTLQKYVPGQTQWDYIASTRFSTLKNGINTYVLKTFDAEDKQTGSLIFTIDYNAPTIPGALPSVGASHWLALMISLLIAGSYTIFRKFRWL